MKNYALEGLRGLAAVMVLLSHLTLVFWPAAQVNTLPVPVEPWQIKLFDSPATFFYSGNVAVCIFFVMSGYVLTAKFWRLRDARVIADLAARRYIRLAPPILISLLIGYTIVHGD
jgi:peptidoglycan/LPS O-acetylase OafA/YrhL